MTPNLPSGTKISRSWKAKFQSWLTDRICPVNNANVTRDYGTDAKKLPPSPSYGSGSGDFGGGGASSSWD